MPEPKECFIWQHHKERDGGLRLFLRQEKAYGGHFKLPYQNRLENVKFIGCNQKF